jgi:hypothetical protein
MGVLDASTSPLKERYAVSKHNIIQLIQPGNVEDRPQSQRSQSRILSPRGAASRTAPTNFWYFGTQPKLREPCRLAAETEERTEDILVDELNASTLKCSPNSRHRCPVRPAIWLFS